MQEQIEQCCSCTKWKPNYSRNWMFGEDPPSGTCTMASGTTSADYKCFAYNSMFKKVELEEAISLVKLAVRLKKAKGPWLIGQEDVIAAIELLLDEV